MAIDTSYANNGYWTAIQAMTGPQKEMHTKRYMALLQQQNGGQAPPAAPGGPPNGGPAEPAPAYQPVNPYQPGPEARYRDPQLIRIEAMPEGPTKQAMLMRYRAQLGSTGVPGTPSDTGTPPIRTPNEPIPSIPPYPKPGYQPGPGRGPDTPNGIITGDYGNSGVRGMLERRQRLMDLKGQMGRPGMTNPVYGNDNIGKTMPNTTHGFNEAYGPNGSLVNRPSDRGINIGTPTATAQPAYTGTSPTMAAAFAARKAAAQQQGGTAGGFSQGGVARYDDGGTAMMAPGQALQNIKMGLRPATYNSMLPTAKDMLSASISTLGAEPVDFYKDLEAGWPSGADPNQGITAGFNKGGEVKFKKNPDGSMEFSHK